MAGPGSMLISIANRSRTRKSSRRGSVAIQMGMLMTVLIGMAALGTEIPYLMYKQRQMQTAADSAALGAAVALTQGYPAIATEADGIAAALGFTNGTGNRDGHGQQSAARAATTPATTAPSK